MRFMGGSSDGGGGGIRGPDHPGKSQVAVGFLKNAGPIEKQLDPISRDVRTALCEIR